MIDSNTLQFILQLVIQGVLIVVTGLMLYYRLKGRLDSNTQDIQNILVEMRDNGFVKKTELKREIEVSKDQHDRQNEETGHLRKRVDFLEGLLMKGLTK